MTFLASYTAHGVRMSHVCAIALGDCFRLGLRSERALVPSASLSTVSMARGRARGVCGCVLVCRKIVDKVSMLEMRGRLALHLGRLGDARDAYTELFRRNKDNEVYALCLLACHPEEELSSLCRVHVTSW